MNSLIHLHQLGKLIPVQWLIKEFPDKLIALGLHPVIFVQRGGKHHDDTFLPDIFRQVLIFAKEIKAGHLRHIDVEED